MTTMNALTDAIAPVVDDLAPAARPSPSWSDLRRFVDRAAADRGEWAGAPIPVDHVPLVMEPRYPFKNLNGAKFGEPKPAAVLDDSFTLLNEWYSEKRGCSVFVCREANGMSRGYTHYDVGIRMRYWMNTLGVAAQQVWDVATETRAMEKLLSLVSAQAYRCYVLSGMFLETSPRSKVTYLFRKLRPTIALRPNADGLVAPLAALCLHPLGYYAESWAGVMTPTDDVIAHLMLMRGDEHGFWRKANHHPVWLASAGV